MKMMKLTYLLAFALAITLADTGCRNHRPVKVTQIPGSPSGQVGELGPGGTMAQGGQTQTGGGQTTDLVDFEGMGADRAALASYTVHFAYDSAVVRKGEKANVQSVAEVLSRDASTKLLIEGHCDERGTEEYNRSLGERRALSLRQALAKIGVDPSRIRTISYGKDKPADPGHDESAWSKNRRGEFVLLHPKSGS
jgi:peptidoglycan-associated lipoprotein